MNEYTPLARIKQIGVGLWAAKQPPQSVLPVAWGENEPGHNSFEGSAKTQGWYQKPRQTARLSQA